MPRVANFLRGGWCCLISAVILTARAGSVPEDIAFTAESDRTEQRYVLVLPEGFDPGGKTDLLIALHGHGSDRWQFVKDPRDECRAARDAAAKYHLIFVSPDYRARTSWMGPKAEADLVQIIGALRKQYKIGRIFLVGGSMGATGALTFAALHPDLVDGVAALNGTANLLEYENFQDAIQASFGGTKAQIPDEYKRRSAEYWPERLIMRVAITASGQDTLVPPQSVQRLAAVLQKLGRKVLLIYGEKEGHQTNYADSLAAIEFAIRSSP